MKRLLTIWVAMIYLVMSTGFVVNIHYCMGDIASVVIGEAPDSDRCAKCGMGNDGCCKDETLVVKYDESQVLLKNTVDGFKTFTGISLQPIQVSSPIFSLPYTSFISYNPPDYSKPPLSVLHSVFRI